MISDEVGGNTHRVCVFELDRRVLELRDFASTVAPGSESVRGCLYVATTERQPHEEYASQKWGRSANRFVKSYGISIRYDLFNDCPPMSLDEARRMAVSRAAVLRERGYAVWQR